MSFWRILTRQEFPVCVVCFEHVKFGSSPRMLPLSPSGIGTFEQVLNPAPNVPLLKTCSEPARSQRTWYPSRSGYSDVFSPVQLTLMPSLPGLTVKSGEG